MPLTSLRDNYFGIIRHWSDLSLASKSLVIYGILMIGGFVLTYLVASAGNPRTIRDVGIWVKPMKFMAATALFAWTTVFLATMASTSVSNGQAFNWISALIIVTATFEVVYITYQASQGAASHYNTSDKLHSFLFGLMAIAAVGLTASQAWLAWEIWKDQAAAGLSTVTTGILIGLVLTFLLSTISGFLLGGNQPPAGQGLPIVGWHLRQDIRPSHFLGVHAQQIIPLWGLFAFRFFGEYATLGLSIGSIVYVLIWLVMTVLSLGS